MMGQKGQQMPKSYGKTTSTQTTMTQQSEGQPEHSGISEWEQALESHRQTPCHMHSYEVDLFPYSFFTCKLEIRISISLQGLF